MSARPKPEAETAAPHHPCVLGALVEDVGRYLVGPDAPEPARRRAAQEAFRHARDDFERFADSSRAGSEVVIVKLTIRGSGVCRQSVYTRVPGPLALLLVAARNCRPGDRVLLRQVTAKCGEVEQSARWPFGMAEAESMTRPATARFDGLAGSGIRELRHRCRDLGRCGVFVFERARGDTAVRLPRLWSWRPETGSSRRGLRMRWRRTTLCIGWSSGRVRARPGTVLAHR